MIVCGLFGKTLKNHKYYGKQEAKRKNSDEIVENTKIATKHLTVEKSCAILSKIFHHRDKTYRHKCSEGNE